MEILKAGGEKSEPVQWGRKHPPCRSSIHRANKASKYSPCRFNKTCSQGLGELQSQQHLTEPSKANSSQLKKSTR